ncbi:hypothetical protein ES703_37909 [subsurface metagenome]
MISAQRHEEHLKSCGSLPRSFRSSLNASRDRNSWYNPSNSLKPSLYRSISLMGSVITSSGQWFFLSPNMAIGWTMSPCCCHHSLPANVPSKTALICCLHTVSLSGWLPLIFTPRLVSHIFAALVTAVMISRMSRPCSPT